MDKEFWLIIGAGVGLFFRDLISKFAWSIFFYLTRGEFNYDNDESTPDRFLLLNPYKGTFTECWIVNYTLFGVGWGFFTKGGLVYKKSDWISWISFKHLRFPYPIDIEQSEINSVLSIISKL